MLWRSAASAQANHILSSVARGPNSVAAELLEERSWQRFLPAEVAIARHSCERESATTISTPGRSRPDEWLWPVLDQFQNELPVDDLQATRLEVLPARRHANRDPRPAVATSVPYNMGPEVGLATRGDLDAHLRLRRAACLEMWVLQPRVAHPRFLGRGPSTVPPRIDGATILGIRDTPEVLAAGQRLHHLARYFTGLFILWTEAVGIDAGQHTLQELAGGRVLDWLRCHLPNPGLGAVLILVGLSADWTAQI